MRTRHAAGGVRKQRGRWVGLWYENGIKKSQTLGLAKEMTKSDAREAVAKIVADVRTKQETSSVLRFAGLVETVYWPFYTRKWKHSTKTKNCVRVNAHLIREFGERELGSFKRDELQDLLDAKAKTHSFTTVNNLRWDLKQIFEMAVAEGHIKMNPALLLFTPKSAAKPSKEVMSPSDIREFLDSLDRREKVIAKLAVLAGMRPGEIFAARWGDVGETFLEVRQRVYEGVIDSPKSERGYRKVALPAGLRAEIGEYRSATMMSPQSYVFPSEAGTPLSKNNVWNRYMKPKLAPVELDWCNFQVMRRTFTTLAKSNGGDAKAIADQAGHDIGVSLREYVQTPLGVKLDLVNNLEQILLG